MVCFPSFERVVSAHAIRTAVPSLPANRAPADVTVRSMARTCVINMKILLMSEHQGAGEW